MTISTHPLIALGLGLILLTSNFATATTSSWSTSVRTSSLPTTSSVPTTSHLITTSSGTPTTSHSSTVTTTTTTASPSCSVSAGYDFDVVLYSGIFYPTVPPPSDDYRSRMIYAVGQSGCTPNSDGFQSCLNNYLSTHTAKRDVNTNGVQKRDVTIQFSCAVHVALYSTLGPGYASCECDVSMTCSVIVTCS